MNKQQNRYRWLVFFAVLFTYLLITTQRTAPGLITDQIMQEFSVNATTIGILMGMQYFVYTSLQIPMGMMADRFGPHVFLILGTALTGIGTVLYSMGTHEVLLFLARIMIGIGDATIWVNLVLILSQWFHAQEFTRLIGIAAMTGSLGFLLATFPFALVIEFLGWRQTFFLSGALLCLSSFLLYVVLFKKQSQRIKESTSKVQFEKQRKKTTVLLRKIFTSRQAWALFFCHFGIVGTFLGFISSWAVPYGMDMFGMTRAEASQLIMLSFIGALIGSPLISSLSSKLEAIKKPYFTVYVLYIVGWLLLVFFKGSPPLFFLYVLFFIIGLTFGGNALTFAAVRKSFPMNESGMASGFANTGGFFSAVLLPSLFGNVLDYFQSVTGQIVDGYFYGLFLPVIFSIFGLIGVICLKENQQGMEGEQTS